MNVKQENAEIERIANIARVFAPAVVHTFANGHSGWGWYVHNEDYPDEGAVFLGTHSSLVRDAILIVAYETAATESEF